DVPGPQAPLEKRWRYHSALLSLALRSHQPGQVKASMAALATMADKENCTRCRFDVLLAQARQAVRVSTPAAGQPYLDQASALQASVTQQQREKTVLDLQEKYAAERKSAQIARLSAQNNLKQAQLAAEAWRNRLWIALAAALALGTMLLLQSIRRARQANRQLAVANAALAEQSMVDPLTGAFNRRHTQALLERLQQGLARRRAHEAEAPTGTGLLLLDLDFFKRINDTWGHAAGDAVLVAVAQRLRTLLRQDDVVARWGGEEFVLVLPNTSAQALSALARHVLHVIGDAPVLVGGQPVAVSVSLGAVSFPAMPGQDWEDALGLADLALYQAKAGGRNRAVCLTRVAAQTDIARLNQDLAQAQAAGDVELTVVT
ncbi:MAG TPA: GGDEF domain-containing protein, partial [Ktedonobacterales bacterium]|nr:GGDEF domain-containing protein [Ktedonobacterales bacterium]